MEKGATFGLLSLAGCDLIFCVFTIFDTFYLGDPTMITYPERNISFYLNIYGAFIQNILIKTSTSFTVIMAVSRHAAVCYPMQARQYIRLRHTISAIIVSFIFWILLHIPLLWSWDIMTISCPMQGKLTILIIGEFVRNKAFHMSFTWLWAILGFFLPVIILAYCNVRLILSLRRSKKFHIAYTNNDSLEVLHVIQDRISRTLVAMVVMFFLCVTPSEIYHFIIALSSRQKQINYHAAMVICNLLQVINFSANFLLYCIVNSTFRKSVLQLLLCNRSRVKFHGNSRSSSQLVQSPSRNSLHSTQLSTVRTSLI